MRLSSFLILGFCLHLTKAQLVFEDNNSITHTGNLDGESFCEESQVGEVIYTLKATGGAEPYKYSILTPDFTAYITLNGDTGEITLNRAFDRESKSSFEVSVFVQDGSSTSYQSKSTVAIKDANDNFPFIENQPYSSEVYEYPWSGEKRLIKITASDEDDGYAGAIAWTIEDPSLQLTIENEKLESTYIIVRDGAKLNYEDSPVLTAKLIASDFGGAYCNINVNHSSSTTVLVNVLDGPDQAPFFTAAPYYPVIKESAPVGQNIINVTAIDRDFGLRWNVTYSIMNDDLAEKLFAIDSSSGEITVKDTIDRESSNVANGVVQFTVKAIEVVPDNSNFSNSIIPFPFDTTATVTLTINDVNDNVPIFYNLPDITDTTSKVEETMFSTSMEENTATSISVPGLSIYVQDKDDVENAKFELKIVGEESDIFEVTPTTVLGEAVLTLRVKNSSALDFEIRKSFTVMLVAEEDGASANMYSNATVVIYLNDTNDWSPEFIDSILEASVPENAEIGASVANVTATDKDSGENKEITYSIITETSGFSINHLTGEVTLSECLDREHLSVYYVTIEAKDGGGRFTLATLKVTIEDINDHEPRFQRSSYSGIVQENKANFPSPLVVYASDDDESNTTNSIILYSIYDGDLTQNFTVFPKDARYQEEGEIQLNEPLDLESLDPSLRDCESGSAVRITLIVLAEDEGSPPLSSTVNVTITIEDVNDHTPIFNQSSYSASIPERSPNGEKIIKVFATDDDACSQNNYIEYLIDLNGTVNSLNAFSIDSEFESGRRIGVLKVRDSNLNREAIEQYEVVILAVDSGETRLTGTATVSVKITDINDEAPIFNSTSFKPLLVSEASPVNEIIRNIVATDADLNSTLQYNISNADCHVVDGGCEDWFKINTNVITQTGELIIANPLDREAVQSITLKITVTDLNAVKNIRTNFGNQMKTEDLEITIEDANDNFPEFDATVIERSVTEEAEKVLIGEAVVAVDKDIGDNGEVTYSIVNESEVNVMIDDSGQLRTTKPIDRETNGDWLNITVTATDKGLSPKSSNVAVAIRIQDINDNTPIFEESSYNGIISEADTFGTVVATVKAIDNDTGSYAHISYSIIAGNELHQFDINETSTSGIIFVSKSAELDREQWPSYALTIRATDDHGQRGSHQENVVVNVNITDENDNAPEFSQSWYTVDFREDGSEGDEVATVTATDADMDKNKEISYYIIEGNNDGHFDIKPSGEVVLNSSISNENVPHYNLTIMAKDNGNIPKNSTCKLVISVIDINQNDPVFDPIPPSENISVPENSEAGVFVYQVHATDQDRGKNGEVMYEFVIDQDYFSLDMDSGKITTRVISGMLDAETELSYSVTVKATDKAGTASQRSTTISFTIKVTDVNDEEPYFKNENKEQILSVLEQEPTDVIIGVIKNATDDDVEPSNRKNFYFIVGGSGYTNFSLNASSQVLSTLTVLDRETLPEFDLVVKASSTPNYMATNPPFNWEDVYKDDSMLHVIINVGDINDNPPRFSKDLYEQDMPFDTQPSTEVTIVQVVATDKDVGVNADIRFSIRSVSWVLGNSRTDSLDTFNISSSAEDVTRGNIYLIGQSVGDQSGYYELIVQATDGIAKDDTKVKIGIVVADETVILYSRFPPEQFATMEDEFMMDLENILKAQVYVDKIIPHQAVSDSDSARSDVYIHAKEYNSTSLIPSQDVIDTLNKQSSITFLNAYGIVGNGNPTTATETPLEVYFQFGLIAAGILLIVLVVIFTIAIVCMRKSYNRKMNVVKATESAAKDMLMMKNAQAMENVPNTNQFVGNENPLFSGDQKEVIDIDFQWMGAEESRDDDDNSIDDNAVDGHDSAIDLKTNNYANLDNDQDFDHDQFPIDFPDEGEDADHLRLAAALNAAAQRRGAENLTFIFDQGDDSQTAL